MDRNRLATIVDISHDTVYTSSLWLHLFQIVVGITMKFQTALNKALKGYVIRMVGKPIAYYFIPNGYHGDYQVLVSLHDFDIPAITNEMVLANWEVVGKV